MFTTKRLERIVPYFHLGLIYSFQGQLLRNSNVVQSIHDLINSLLVIFKESGFTSLFPSSLFVILKEFFLFYKFLKQDFQLHFKFHLFCVQSLKIHLQV